MNKLKCGDCQHYQVRTREISAGVTRTALVGICGKKSRYLQGDTRAPDGAEFIQGDRADLFAVSRDKVVPTCPHANPR